MSAIYFAAPEPDDDELWCEHGLLYARWTDGRWVVCSRCFQEHPELKGLA